MSTPNHNDLRVAAAMALEQMRLNVENLKEGMTPSMQRLQAQFQEETIEVLDRALNIPRGWIDLSATETKTLWQLTKKPTEYAAMLIAKFKEKNS